jgi:hypothetical protein
LNTSPQIFTLITDGEFYVSSPKSNPMEHNPFWEVGGRIHSQEIFRILWKPKVHYRIHKNSPLDPALSQMDPVHILSAFHNKIHEQRAISKKFDTFYKASSKLEL